MSASLARIVRLVKMKSWSEFFQWKADLQKSPRAGPHVTTTLLYEQSWVR